MSMDYEEVVKLDDLNHGVVKDLFPDEWKALLANVADENTQATAKRSITITITAVPTKDRFAMDTSVTVVSKLAPPKTSESRVLLSSDGVDTTAHFMKDEPKQPGLDLVEFPGKAGGE